MWMQWMVRMSRWAHHPPPMSRVILVAAVVVLCLALVAVDKAGLWPAWLHVNGGMRMHPRLP